MRTVIDARGLSCPQPVIMAMAKMKEMESGEFSVLVDTETSRENVSRTAQSRGWRIKDVASEDNGCRLTLSKS